ncbi:hypothetical protein DL93DRAFT_219944 [Clavulina sp. PMI_390]|nr:hypothetical protein DL93DRAFT_219944 [Clavulina sp. PMI_390]
MRVLRNAISARKNEYGDLLSKGPSHFPAIGLHFNSKPLRPGDALPAKSNNVDDDGEEVEPVQVKMVPPSQDGRRHETRYFQGLDVIAAYGDYDDAYVEIPELGVRIRIDSGDIIAIRGAAFRYRINKEWTGEGQFIIEAFCDRRLFGYHKVARSNSLARIYGERYNKLRSKHRPTLLSSLVI